ncbi:MAG: hypothetical protein PHV30_11355 [Candidatus Margulisbacteria bacterium]|nr:hypothetical protein [Candidatus Margulisiibacteriota bacterium]
MLHKILSDKLSPYNIFCHELTDYFERIIKAYVGQLCAVFSHAIPYEQLLQIAREFLKEFTSRYPVITLENNKVQDRIYDLDWITLVINMAGYYNDILSYSKNKPLEFSSLIVKNKSELSYEEKYLYDLWIKLIFIISDDPTANPISTGTLPDRLAREYLEYKRLRFQKVLKKIL